MFNFLRGKAKQLDREVIADSGVGNIAMTRAQQLFTANWVTELVLAGYCYGVTVGDLANGGGDIALITGGGNGTTVDSDQPELAIGTPSGYYHIPLACNFIGRVDMDADAEVGNVALFMDTTQIIPVPIAASSTVETPVPLLGGGAASVSYAQSAVTTDITDPVCSQMLCARAIRAADFISASGAATGSASTVADLTLDWRAPFPMLFKGPCSAIGVWGGTAAVPGAMAYFWAEVPAARYRV